jgi:hypothetical protein
LTDQIVSLKDRLAARREELQAPHLIELPVPGYEDILVAKYHPLSFRQHFDIESKGDKNPDKAQAVLNAALDKLIAACDGLLSKNEDGTLTDLGHKWSSAAVQDLFGVEPSTPPSVRQDLLKIFPDDLLLISHFEQYANAAQSVVAQAGEKLEGESEPSQEGS